MSTRIFVGNLSFKTREIGLFKFFTSIAPVKDVTIITYQGRSLGYGFAEFETEDGARKAFNELNAKELDGRPINIEYARPKVPRSERPSRPRPRPWHMRPRGTASRAAPTAAGVTTTTTTAPGAGQLAAAATTTTTTAPQATTPVSAAAAPGRKRKNRRSSRRDRRRPGPPADGHPASAVTSGEAPVAAGATVAAASKETGFGNATNAPAATGQQRRRRNPRKPNVSAEPAPLTPAVNAKATTTTTTTTPPPPPAVAPAAPSKAFEGPRRDGGYGQGSQGRRRRGGRGRRMRRGYPRRSQRSQERELSKTRVHIGNLPYNAEDSDLMELFDGLPVIKAYVVMRNGRSLGYGYATFANENDQLQAIEATDKSRMDEREITVSPAFVFKKRTGPALPPTTGAVTVTTTAVELPVVAQI